MAGDGTGQLVIRYLMLRKRFLNARVPSLRLLAVCQGPGCVQSYLLRRNEAMILN